MLVMKTQRMLGSFFKEEIAPKTFIQHSNTVKTNNAL